MRFAALLLLGVVGIVASADAATLRQCKAACAASVSACRAEACNGLGGRRGRRCDKLCRSQTYRLCRVAGLRMCTPPSTTTTSTTLAPATKYYSARDLGTLGGKKSVPLDLNEHGDVVGMSTVGNVTRAFLYTGGVMQDLGTLGGTNSVAMGLNDVGDVVGWSYDGSMDYGRWAFHWRDGVMTHHHVPLLIGRMAINDAGRLVGGHGYDSLPFILPPLDPPLDPSFLSAWDVDESGDLAGTMAGYPEHAAAVIGGSITDLGTLAGPAYPTATSRAYAINAGAVVGDSDTAVFERHAFVYRDGTMLDLGTLRAVNGAVSTATDVNAGGRIIGASDGVPFLYDDGRMVPVADLVDPSLGWLIVSVHAINDKGQLAVAAFTGDPDVHAVLLTPPP